MVAHLQLVPGLADEVAGSRDRPVITVVVADDHALMRRSLRLILEVDETIAVVAEAEDLESAEGHLHGLRPRVLVLDLNMPDGSALAAIGRLRRGAPHTQIVVVTMEDDPGFARRTLAAGASGFVLKDHAEQKLPGAVRLAAGRSAVS